jgi:hypothetical protein
MERLGFRPLKSVEVSHKTKRRAHVFGVYLMWMPVVESAKTPTRDLKRLQDGETFRIAPPLYHPRMWKGNILKLKKGREESTNWSRKRVRQRKTI